MTTTEYTTCCFPAARSPVDYCFKPCIRPNWCSKPGFWDPHAVTEICLPILARSVYSATRTMHLEKASFDEPCGRRIPDGDICRGITMYTEPWHREDCVERAVQRYICFPCKMELTECIDLRPERALAVLLSYLKHRGPFLVWIYRGKGTAYNIGRHLPRTVIQFLTHLPEVEMSAAVAIGRYLSHLLRIAYGHRMMNMRKTLATVWGPIFLKVEPATDIKPPIRMTECEKFDAAVEIFSRMLETVPWHTVTPFQKVTLSMLPNDPCSFMTTNSIRNDCVQELMKEHPHAKGALADILLSEAMEEAKRVEEAKEEAKICETEVEKDLGCVTNDVCVYHEAPLSRCPPDTCDLTYGARTRLPQQDKTS
ncbi:conserved hypothetical protein [Echinococcus multilocularis]|uniref:Uncharacterized protein n=1 Tax=Echinococcus multilocularis TaxID=6211 RepID=A0A068XVV1_ECHMU|nr:conserved hypothetical protein [Echinococcus multilocularis]